MSREIIGQVECQECAQAVDLKKMKGGKLYYTCDDCGVQHFVRYEKGMASILKRTKKQAVNEVEHDNTQTATSSIQAEPTKPKKQRVRVGMF